MKEDPETAPTVPAAILVSTRLHATWYAIPSLQVPPISIPLRLKGWLERSQDEAIALRRAYVAAGGDRELSMHLGIDWELREPPAVEITNLRTAYAYRYVQGEKTDYAGEGAETTLRKINEDQRGYAVFFRK